MNIWCGDEAVAQIYAKLLREGPSLEGRIPGAKLTVAPMNASAFEPLDMGWFELPPIAQVMGNMAVIKIAGGLVPGEAGWMRIRGMIGYEDIKAALEETSTRNDLQGVLLYVDSPGGSTNGLKATAEYIKAFSANVKPVVAYAATACSAGYWLASAASHIVCDETSTMGSIGTIIQLVNYTGANEKEGISYNIFKSGSLKMAGNPDEELSEEAKKLFQGIVDDMTAIFMSALATNRKMPYETVKARFGDGRHMLGARAAALGLADELGSRNTAIIKLQNLISAKTSSNLVRV